MKSYNTLIHQFSLPCVLSPIVCLQIGFKPGGGFNFSVTWTHRLAVSRPHEVGLLILFYLCILTPECCFQQTVPSPREAKGKTDGGGAYSVLEVLHVILFQTGLIFALQWNTLRFTRVTHLAYGNSTISKLWTQAWLPSQCPVTTSRNAVVTCHCCCYHWIVCWFGQLGKWALWAEQLRSSRQQGLWG